MHFPDRVLRAPLRPIAIRIRIEVCFKDRFQQQLSGGLHHPVPYGWNPKWTLAPARFRDFHPPHSLWCIRLCSKFIPDTAQPFPQPCRFDLREALPIHSRRALIGLCQCICMVQNVFPVYLVVEKIETVVRLFLRFLVQLPLKHPDLNWCLQAHRQSPLLCFFKSTSEVRVLPSAGATRHPRCRVGGGALARWPPSAAQTVRAVFPHTRRSSVPCHPQTPWCGGGMRPPSPSLLS